MVSSSSKRKCIYLCTNGLPPWTPRRFESLIASRDCEWALPHDGQQPCCSTNVLSGTKSSMKFQNKVEKSLPDLGALPSAIATRRRPKYIRQSVCRVLHLVNNTRQPFTRQRVFCRVFSVGHSAKKFPCVYLSTRQKKFE